jgi:hypothetical protein
MPDDFCKKGLRFGAPPWGTILEAIAKPLFTVILNGVKDLKSLKYEILRSAQNDTLRPTRVLQ